MKWNDEGFVDLYDLLDVWPDAETGALRKRISELYLEARENVDHQSHRKRFYYRELYELQLPQARRILLNEAARRDYDHELQQFWKNKGQPPAPRKPKDVSRPKLEGIPGQASEYSSEEVDPFAEFADIGEDKLPPLEMPHLTMDAKAVEQRRDHKRRELIKHELIVIGFRGMMIGGIGVALLGVLLVVVFNMAFGLSAIVMTGCGVLTLALAAFAGRQTMRWAKQRTIGALSKMPYDELLRHSIGH